MADNPILSQVTLPSGSVYDLADTKARADIEALNKYTAYLGVTTTALTDGATTNPITVNSKSVTAVNGNIANYGAKEFIFNGTAWQEFGDLSGLGSLGYKDTASGSYKPTGSVSKPTFTGNELTSTGKVTASGSVSQPTFTGTKGDVSVSGMPSGDVSQPTFTGNAMTSTGNFTPTGNVTIGVDTEGTVNYTPAGNVSAPTISVSKAGTTTTVNSITDVGSLPKYTAPELKMTVTGENLKFEWDAGSYVAGTLPTKGNNVTVKTGDASYTASTPTFSGTGTALKATFTGTRGSVSVSGTPGGTVSTPTFTGKKMTATGEFTPEGNVSQPSFTGTAVDVSVKGTPSGDVSKPTFSGTEATINVT